MLCISLRSVFNDGGQEAGDLCEFILYGSAELIGSDPLKSCYCATEVHHVPFIVIPSALLLPRSWEQMMVGV